MLYFLDIHFRVSYFYLSMILCNLDDRIFIKLLKKDEI